MTRREILSQAKTMVCGHREQDYGTPENNFATIAELWTAYLDTPIDSVDVAMCMALLKIARVKGGGTDDCFIDLAGYAACGGELNEKLRLEESDNNTPMNRWQDYIIYLYKWAVEHIDNKYACNSPMNYQSFYQNAMYNREG